MARFAAVILALALGAASAFVPARVGSNAAVTMSATSSEQRAAAAAAAAVLTAGIASPALAITAEERAQLSYLQVKGTGLANRCSEVKGSDSLSVKSGAKSSAGAKRQQGPGTSEVQGSMEVDGDDDDDDFDFAF